MEGREGAGKVTRRQFGQAATRWLVRLLMVAIIAATLAGLFRIYQGVA